ncbi:hypothetical protein VPH35_044328 [Triticum aestivum]
MTNPAAGSIRQLPPPPPPPPPHDHNASHSPASHRIRVSVLPSSCASASPSLSAIGPREDAAWPGHIVVVLVSGHHHPDLHHHRCPVAHLSAGAEEETRQPPSLISVRRPSPCSSAACVMRFSAGAGARDSPTSSPHRRTFNHASV